MRMHRAGANGDSEYLVYFGPGEDQWISGHALSTVSETLPIRTVGRPELMRNLALVKMRVGFDDVLYSYLASRTQVEPYQFRPAAKFLDSASHRLLIADEVGLGKTIEAGIIFLEMKARNPMKRVLVVCPSRLRAKWVGEFRSRFNESLEVLNRANFMRFLDEYERFQDASSVLGVIGMEVIRDSAIRERMEEVGVSFDLVIIDEAHHLRNQSTQMHRVGLMLSNYAEAMLMLSATPINIRQEDLYHLLHILDGGEFPNMQMMNELFAPVSVLNIAMRALGREESKQRNALNELKALSNSPIGRQIMEYPEYEDIAQRLSAGKELDRAEFVQIKRVLSALSPLNNHVNRTRKRDVQANVTREPHVVSVAMKARELDLYYSLLEYAKLRHFSINQSTPPGFVLVTRERQITSCLPAAAELLLKDALAGDIGYEGNDVEIDESPYVPDRLNDSPDAQVELERHIRTLLEEIGDTDSKLEKFMEGLREIHVDNPNAKVLIFSSFKATLRYLEKRLRSEAAWINGGVHRLDGDVAVGERPRIIDRFKEANGFSVLLMSEVGAEGLDFQFTDIMFNYDLPWNPMRVEQRIGRIDRYGQSSQKVRVYSYILQDTVEERILLRLYERIRVFHESIGEMEPVLGDIIENLTRTLFTSTLTPLQEEEMREQILNSLEVKKADQKELERIEEELMGQDILFGQERDGRVETGRYLGADELQAVLESGLSGYNTSLKDNGDRSFYLWSTPVLRRDVAAFCEAYKSANGLRIPHEVRRELLAGLDKNGIPLTFSGELAQQRELCHLVNFDHPLIRFAASRIPEAETNVNNLALVKLASPDWPAGIYPFFIYRINITAADSRSELGAIVLDEHNGVLIEPLSSRLFADLWQTAQWNGPHPVHIIGADSWPIYEDYGRDAITAQRDAVERQVKERNDRLVNRRVAALKRTYDVKRGRLEQWRSEAADDRIRRMRETQIANAAAEVEGKLMAQEQLRSVAVGTELIMQGVIGVGIPDEE